MEWLQNILELDKELFLYLNSFYNDFWDTIMLMITRKETWIPFYLVIIFYFFKSYHKKAWLILLFLALTIAASDQISVFIKETVQRLRPVHEPALENLVHNVLRKGGLHGFVSSHASNTFAIYVFTSRIFKNKSYSLLLLFWAIVVSYSRIYSGVHYPLDIICGAILGIFIGWLMFKAMLFVDNHFLAARFPKIEKNRLSVNGVRNIYLVFGVSVLSYTIMTYLLHYYNYL